MTRLDLRHRSREELETLATPSQVRSWYATDRSVGEFTQLLDRARAGDERAADEVVPIVYGELRALAQALMNRERPDHTLQATALVHEAYLRLVGQQRTTWQNRAHFLALASQALRRILVDHARARGRDKRGGGATRIALDEEIVASYAAEVDLVAVDHALDALAARSELQARIVELRFFGGLTTAEVAQVVDRSQRTVEREWRFARAWLYRTLAEEPE